MNILKSGQRPTEISQQQSSSCSLLQICRMVILVCALAIAGGADAQQADNLLVEMGCNTCHLGLKGTNTVAQKAPDLSSAGERYEPAYLFSYLQNPESVRKYIGAARMPNYAFNEQEALALTLFLQKQAQDAEAASVYPTEIVRGTVRSKLDAESAIKKSGCLVCHSLRGTYLGAGTPTGSELSEIGFRLQGRWLRKYLASPEIFGVQPTVMPGVFYRFAADKKTLKALDPENAADRLNTIARFITGTQNRKRDKLKADYKRALEMHPKMTAALGEKIFYSQNCLACHRLSGAKPPFLQNAPDLSDAGSRFNKDWLTAYLQKPKTIRPAGFHVGSFSRMPDFNLSAQEIEKLAAALMANTKQGKNSFKPDTLSAYKMAKAKSLLDNKLSCLGCHRLGGDGGRVGPDLSQVSRRLQAGYINKIIRSPQAVSKHGGMPKVAMPEKHRALIINYMIQQHIKSEPAPRASLVENEPSFFQRAEGVKALYEKNCASCHGLKGDGEGFNAAFLPTKPTSFADAGHMRTRPDDTLFDGIYAGGYILNKSHTMPPWGKTLTTQEIRALVQYIRTFCKCSQPAWAGDGMK